MFSVLGEVDAGQFHIRHWKAYDAYYNDDSEIGKKMVLAQVIVLHA
jgi:hypothetical protein